MITLKNGDGIKWPHGKRIAVLLTFDFDAEYLRYSVTGQSALGFSDISRGQYGPHEGLKRCLDMLARQNIKTTFFVPGIVAEKYADEVKQIAVAGHELAYHGYAHDARPGIPFEEEEANMAKAEAILEAISGKKVVGHRAPLDTLQTYGVKLMQKRGYLYSSTLKDCDWAYIHEGEHPVVELPTEPGFDDFSFFYFSYADAHTITCSYPAEYVYNMWKDAFDGAQAASACWSVWCFTCAKTVRGLPAAKKLRAMYWRKTERRLTPMLWPNNKRLALMLSFDIDAETLWLTRNEINKNHPANLSRGLYSVKQGIPRILRMLEEENQHATFFTTAYTAELHPEVIKCIAACGHEIAYHGYLHEVYDTYEKENALMAKAENIIKGLTGRQMVGQRSPDGFIYDFHLQLWLDRGYIYSSNWRDNDGPFLHKINGKTVPIVELPKDGIVDDTSYDMYTIQAPEHHYLRSGREMTGIWMEEFDGLADEGRMMNFVMHPQFIGRPGYVRALRDFIRYARDNGAWICTDEQAARWVLAQNGFTEFA